MFFLYGFDGLFEYREISLFEYVYTHPYFIILDVKKNSDLLIKFLNKYQSDTDTCKIPVPF